MANYGYINGAKASDKMHHMVYYIDPDEEARQAGMYYYSDGSESYIVKTETSYVEHVAAPPMAEYSYGVKHVHNYGSPVKDQGRARPPEVSTSRGFDGYPTKDKFKDFDGVNDRYRYPVSVYDTEIGKPDDNAWSPGYSSYYPVKKPSGHNYSGSQPQASKPTRVSTRDSDSYGRPYSYDDDNTPRYEVYDEDKSGENPIFSKFRDLYLEYHGGKNIPNVKSKDDNRRSGHPLSKPTGYAGTVMNFPMEGYKLPNANSGALKQPRLTEPVSSEQKNIVRPERTGIVYPERTRSFKPTGHAGTAMNFPTEDYKLPNANPGTIKQPQLTEPVSSEQKYIVRPEKTETFKPTGYAGTAMNFPVEDYKLPNVNPGATKQSQLTEPVSSRPKNIISPERTGSFKPTEYAGTAMTFPMEGNKFPNVNLGAAKQPQLTEPVSSRRKSEMTRRFEPAEQHVRYSPSPNSGEKVSRTTDGAMPNTKSEDDYKRSNLLSKPAGYANTAMNFSKDVTNKLPNSNLATAKQPQLTRAVSSQKENNIRPEITRSFEATKQQGEYLPPKDSGEQKPKTTNGAMASIKSEDDYRKSNTLLSKPTGYANTAVDFSKDLVNKLPNINPFAAKQPQFTRPVSSPQENNIRRETSESFEPPKQPGKYSSPANSGERVSKGNAETAMNFVKDGYNKLSEVVSAAKPTDYWGSVSALEKNSTDQPEKTGNLEGAKRQGEYSLPGAKQQGEYSFPGAEKQGEYSLPPNNGEKKWRAIDSKEAVEKYDGAFVPHN